MQICSESDNFARYIQDNGREDLLQSVLYDTFKIPVQFAKLLVIPMVCLFLCHCDVRSMSLYFQIAVIHWT